MDIIAIVTRENRETITFSGIPTPATTKQLRTLGFDYDSRSKQWTRKHVNSTHCPEHAVYKLFAE